MAKKDGDKKEEKTPVSAIEAVNDKILVHGAVRRKLPKIRTAKTFSFIVGGSKGFVTVGEFEDGKPGEIFMQIAKQGSTLAGIMDALAISISYGLQYGVPLKSYVFALTNMSFAPAGITNDSEIKTATSLVDYVFKRLALTYLSFDDRLELGLASIDDMPVDQTTLLGEISTTEPGPAPVDTSEPKVANIGRIKPEPVAKREEDAVSKDDTAPMCYNCGNQTQRAGSCYVCTACGSTTGCS